MRVGSDVGLRGSADLGRYWLWIRCFDTTCTYAGRVFAFTCSCLSCRITTYVQESLMLLSEYHGLTCVEQQITLYPHRDENNLWRIINGSAPDGPATYAWDDVPFENVLTGSRIRLEHKTTDKRLHSHDIRPSVSDVDFQNEVSGYGFEG